MWECWEIKNWGWGIEIAVQTTHKNDELSSVFNDVTRHKNYSNSNLQVASIYSKTNWPIHSPITSSCV